MRNIPTIFLWDHENNVLGNKPNKHAAWVFEGTKGIATRKYDGIAIKVEKNKVWRRVEWHSGDPMPKGFVRSQDPDPKRPNASLPGWVLVPESFLLSPQGQDERALKEAWGWLRTDLAKVAFNNHKATAVINPYAPTPKEPELPKVPDGTYELCGPKIHQNREGFKTHVLIMHGASLETPTTLTPIKHVPRKYEALKTFLETFDGEGIVWHYKTEGTVLMAKIKRKDFGFNKRFSKEDIEMAYNRHGQPINDLGNNEAAQKDMDEIAERHDKAVATGDTTSDTHKIACETTLF